MPASASSASSARSSASRQACQLAERVDLPGEGGGAAPPRGGPRVGLEEPLITQRVRERCGLQPCAKQKNRRRCAALEDEEGRRRQR